MPKLDLTEGDVVLILACMNERWDAKHSEMDGDDYDWDERHHLLDLGERLYPQAQALLEADDWWKDTPRHADR